MLSGMIIIRIWMPLSTYAVQSEKVHTKLIMQTILLIAFGEFLPKSAWKN